MMEFRKLRSSDTEWHSRFFQFVGAIFRSADAELWQLWRDRGGWTESYEVFAIVDDNRVVGTIGRTRMPLVVNGEARQGYQLGAVATLGPYRRQGLARQLMECVIDAVDEPDQPIILFANHSVLEFYPRFGFRRVPQRRSIARGSIQPSGAQAPRCVPACLADRLRLMELCSRAQPNRGPLAARDYYSVLLWHLTCRSIDAYWLPESDAVIAATTQDGRLVVHDVIAVRPFDLKPVIPTLITVPISELEFGFDPKDWWSPVEYSEFDDSDSCLFVHGGGLSIAGPVQFPALAHT